MQDLLKGKLVVKDDFTWTVPITEERVKAQSLRYIGGVDVSFLKGNASLACGALVILDAYTLEVVYEDYNVVQLDIPYVPGFLAFREVYFHISFSIGLHFLCFSGLHSSFLGWVLGAGAL